MARDIKERVNEIVTEQEMHWDKPFTQEERKLVETGYMIATLDAANEDHQKYDSGLIPLNEIIARSLTAWDTSKDKSQGLLPEVYLHLKALYKRLVGEEYVYINAIKKFNIE